MNLNGLLQGMVKVGASDLHLKAGGPPVMRVTSRLRSVDHPTLTEEELRETLDVILPSQHIDTFTSCGAADFAYMIEGVGRYRVAAFHQQGLVSLAFRLLALDIPKVDELNLPDPVKKLVELRRGMLLVTGVTGSGKTTTMAAILNHINQTRRTHIVTLEDPTEYLFVDSLSIVSQVEVGSDCSSFSSAMQRVLRWDPDIIMIGEMRNRETVESAIAAADTGHLVLSTLHTSDAKQTINRVLHFFPPEEEQLILEQLALNLQAIVSQRLLPRADIKGLIPVVELLFNTPIVTKLIREGKIEDLQQVMKNQDIGMQTFDIGLAFLVRDAKITLEVALAYCADEAGLRRMVRGEFSADDQAGLIGTRGQLGSVPM